MDPRLQLTPIVAIVGRPNVGKSTLFNRLLGKRKALVSAEAGTTRDANYGHFHWRELTYTAIDTAGLDLTSRAATEAALKRQAEAAMAKSDMIVFLADIADGVMPQDKALARELQRSGKKVFLAANKADSPKLRANAAWPEWLKLGFGEPFPVSAANGSGVGDLLDEIDAEAGRRGLASRPLPPIDARVAIVGRPNVGKSSLLNALAGEERVIVSEVPHTTKEPQDTLLTYDDPGTGPKHILLIDTVGIRKRRKVSAGLEKIGVQMSLDEIRRADVALLVIDAARGIDVQEMKLACLLEEMRPGMLIVVNKWDLAEKKQLGTAEKYADYVAGQLPAWPWAPVTFISASTGRSVGRIIRLALEIAAQRRREIPQEELDAFTEKMKKIHHSAFKKGENRPKVFGISQAGTEPPLFMMTVKDKKTIHPNFLRFVENRLREEFGFAGTPIRVLAREINA